MGWSSGSELADEVWALVEKYIPSKNKSAVAKKIVSAFEDHDADDWDREGPLMMDAFEGKPRPGDDDYEERDEDD